jgi:hypothetical protein
MQGPQPTDPVRQAQLRCGSVLPQHYLMVVPGSQLSQVLGGSHESPEASSLQSLVYNTPKSSVANTTVNGWVVAANCMFQ